MTLGAILCWKNWSLLATGVLDCQLTHILLPSMMEPSTIETQEPHVQSELPKHDIVLLGAGHTNMHVLQMWRMQPIPNARLTCVSNFGHASYSGMLPGTLAGQYQPAEMQVDLVRFCAAVGARLIQSEVCGLDVQQQKLMFAERTPLQFDALSIGVGSRPVEVPGDEACVVPIKPMQSFLDRLDAKLTSLAKTLSRPWRLAIVGGGAAGVEIACCLQGHLKQRHPNAKSELALIERGADILKQQPARARRLAREALQQRGINLLVESEPQHINSNGDIRFADGSLSHADLILWTTSARAPAVLDYFQMPKDERGFLLTSATLQSTAANSIFVVGDAGSLEHDTAPKAGVSAVRQGPILWENLQRQVRGQPLKDWHPQRSFLTLLNTGDERAVLTYKGLGVHASWCWRLKDYIDRRFIRKYQDYAPAMRPQKKLASATPLMHCGGCGSKLPSDILTRVLADVDNPSHQRVRVGLSHRDDVAIIETGSGSKGGASSVAVSTDFFTAFVDDAHLLGRIAAENALSDLYASGSTPHSALAQVTVPYGPPQKQEQFLREVIEGALVTLRHARTTLVGGHTIEGSQATVGFTILGDVGERECTTKANLIPGENLVLTKPLGTGILLAGHQQALCQAEWWESLIEIMLQSNADAALVASKLGIRTVTDVTGFGLAGHLYEMLQDSIVSCKLSLKAVPVLPGAIELSMRNVQSTLAPGNRSFESHIAATAATNQSDRYPLLFDPQTSGGLLMSVSDAALEAVLDQIETAAVIGKVCEIRNERPQIFLSK